MDNKLEHKKRGLFITLEGPDGGGKTTHAAGIAERLLRLGHEVVMTREPGGTAIGEQVRGLLLDPNSHMAKDTEAFLYAAARVQLVNEVILPSLALGKVVLCDRYIDSTLAYQGYGRGLDRLRLAELNRLATGGLMPDITLLFDLAPELGARRRQKARGVEDRLELAGLDFHQRVRDGYLALAEEERERIVVIDAAKSMDEVALAAWQAVKTRLDQEVKSCSAE